MPPEPPAAPDRWYAARLRAVWVLWFVVLVALLSRGLIAPNKNSCFRDHYRPAGVNWLNGNELYSSTADTCRYSPAVHVALVPFSALPERWGAFAWRLVQASALFVAVWWWLRTVCPAALDDRHRSWVLFLTLPLCTGSLNNGQSNVLMTAGVLACVAAVVGRYWTLAAVAIAVACLFKIYPIAMALLIVVLYPRQFGSRFVLALLAGLALPFAFQNPEYVARQYGRWFENLKGDDRSGWVLDEAYRDAWLLVRVTGLPLSVEAYRLLSVGAGAALGAFCVALRLRGDSGPELVNRVLGLGCCWMTAFGPATESPTYILLGPTVGWLLVESWRGAHPRWTRVPVTLAAGLFFTTVHAATTPPYGRQLMMLGTQPAASLLLLFTLVTVCVVRPARPTERAAVLPFDSRPPVRNAA